MVPGSCVALFWRGLRRIWVVRTDLHTCAGGDAADQAHRPSDTVLREDPFTASEQDGLDHQVELVDQAPGEQGPNEARAAPDQQVAAVLVAECGDLSDRVVAGQQRRVIP